MRDKGGRRKENLSANSIFSQRYEDKPSRMVHRNRPKGLIGTLLGARGRMRTMSRGRGEGEAARLRERANERAKSLNIQADR